MGASELVGREACVLRDAREHSRPELFGLVKCKGNVGPSGFAENAVRAFLTLDAPACVEECRQDARRLGAIARRWWVCFGSRSTHDPRAGDVRRLGGDSL